MLRALLRGIDIVVDALTWLAGGVCLLMALHVTADLTARDFFNHPLAGTDEIATAYYMVALTFLPLGVITRKREHIRVMLFTGKASPRASLWFDIVAALATLVFTGIVLWTSVHIAISKTAIREVWEASTASGYLAVWPSRWVVVAGFALMCVYLVINLVRDLRALRGGPGRDVK